MESLAQAAQPGIVPEQSPGPDVEADAESPRPVLDAHALVADYIRLTDEIALLQARKALIATDLTSLAAFAPGSKTGKIYLAGYEDISVSTGETVSWDQDVLQKQVRPGLGEPTFWDLFTFEVKPVKSQKFKALLTKLDPLNQALVLSARSAKPKTPTIKITKSAA
jgi:hypothetical protein